MATTRWQRCSYSVRVPSQYHDTNVSLSDCRVPVSVRARGVFFLPTDQQSDRPVVNTNYQGLAYMGEYPLTWSAFLCNEGIYNLLLEKGADPDAQVSIEL